MEGLLASALDELRRVQEETRGAAAEVAGLRTQITWFWLTFGAQTVLQLLVVTFLVGVLNSR